MGEGGAVSHSPALSVVDCIVLLSLGIFTHPTKTDIPGLWDGRPMSGWWIWWGTAGAGLLTLGAFFVWFLLRCLIAFFRWAAGYRPQPPKPRFRAFPVVGPIQGAEGTIEPIRWGNFPKLLSFDVTISGDDSLDRAIGALAALTGGKS